MILAFWILLGWFCYSKKLCFSLYSMVMIIQASEIENWRNYFIIVQLPEGLFIGFLNRPAREVQIATCQEKNCWNLMVCNWGRRLQVNGAENLKVTHSKKKLLSTMCRLNSHQFALPKQTWKLREIWTYNLLSFWWFQSYTWKWWKFGTLFGDLRVNNNSLCWPCLNISRRKLFRFLCVFWWGGSKIFSALMTYIC